jgi:hypothetical protein
MKTPRRLYASLLSLLLLFSGSIFFASTAKADSLEVLGGVVTWPDKMYLPDGCSSFAFQYRNGTGVGLLLLGFIISDPFGRKVEDQSEIGIDPNKSGTWNVQMCSFDFKNGLGPYTIKVFVKDYSSTQREVQKEIYFLPIPNSTGSGSGLSPAPTVTVTATPAPAPTVTVTATPAPAPTVTVTATPAPAPTVTVTATPAPAPTVTVTATPAPAPTVYVTKPSDKNLADLVTSLKSQVNLLNAKVKRICTIKPKPKGC